MSATILLVLICLGICHWVCDYIFVTPEMLAAKRIGRPFLPIFDHALDHAFLMGVILFAFGVSNFILLALFQLVAHFLIDIGKGFINLKSPKYENPRNKCHWVIFGLDQFLHFLTIVIMVYLIKL